jgi:glutamate transport system permease protein
VTSVLYDAPGPRARALNRVLTVVGLALVVGVVAFVVWRLQSALQLTGAKWSVFSYTDIQHALLRAWWATMRIALVSIVFSVVLGAVLAALRLSTARALSLPATVLVQFLRAPPVLLMMFWFFYGAGGGIPVFWCGVLGLTLYNGAIIAEILRAGVRALPAGQREAGLAIGLSPSQVTWTILLPQALRSMLPSLLAQVVVILKDTALIYILGYPELLRWGTGLGTQYFNLVPATIVIAVVYIATNSLVAGAAKLLERRLSTTGRTTRTAAVASTPEQVGGGGGTH